MIKKFNDFLNENNSKIPEVDVKIDPKEIIDNLKNGKIEIDLKKPKGYNEVSERFLDGLIKSLIRTLEIRIKSYEKRNDEFIIDELPYDLDFHYTHPISNEYCSFVLVSKDRITLATLESENGEYYYSEISVPEPIIKGDYYTFDLDIPSGKMCFCGDWVRDIFVEKEWGDMKYSSDYHRVESDAVEHIEHFLKNGYFFVPDSFYPTLSKKDDTYYLYNSGEYYKDELGKVIKDSLGIDSDHTMVIIDGDVLEDKFKENQEEYDTLNDFYKKYMKYCLNVQPGKYEIHFNWRFGKENDTLIYFKIKKK